MYLNLQNIRLQYCSWGEPVWQMGHWTPLISGQVQATGVLVVTDCFITSARWRASLSDGNVMGSRVGGLRSSWKLFYFQSIIFDTRRKTLDRLAMRIKLQYTLITHHKTTLIRLFLIRLFHLPFCVLICPSVSS